MGNVDQPQPLNKKKTIIKRDSGKKQTHSKFIIANTREWLH